jgi:hypothetical protein
VDRLLEAIERRLPEDGGDRLFHLMGVEREALPRARRRREPAEDQQLGERGGHLGHRQRSVIV